MALNLAKLKTVEEEVVDIPHDDEAVAVGGEAATAAPTEAKTTADADDYADLVNVITPSAPPTIDEAAPVAKAAAPAAEAAKPEATAVDPAAAVDTAEVSAPAVEDVVAERGVGGLDPLGNYSDLLATMDPEAVRELEGRARSAAVEEAARKAGVDPRDAHEADREQQMYGRAGGGGLADLAIGLVAAPFIGAALGVSKFRQILNQQKGIAAPAPAFTAEALHDRIFELKSQQMQRNTVAMLKAGDDLADRVDAFNETFTASDRMPTLQAEIAKADGKTAAEVLASVTNGTATPEQIAAARHVLADPAVAEAWHKVEAQIGELQKSQELVHRDFDLLNKNFPEKFDAEGEAETLEDAVKTSIASVPAPIVEDPDAKKKMAERLREMAENLIERIKNLIARIMQMGRAAK